MLTTHKSKSRLSPFQISSNFTSLSIPVCHYPCFSNGTLRRAKSPTEDLHRRCSGVCTLSARAHLANRHDISPGHHGMEFTLIWSKFVINTCTKVWETSCHIHHNTLEDPGHPNNSKAPDAVRDPWSKRTRPSCGGSHSTAMTETFWQGWGATFAWEARNAGSNTFSSADPSWRGLVYLMQSPKSKIEKALWGKERTETKPISNPESKIQNHNSRGILVQGFRESFMVFWTVLFPRSWASTSICACQVVTELILPGPYL